MAGTRVGVDQRALIVRAAHRAVAEQGLGGLRVRAVAQDAGITHATLHHYFPTKADLVRAVDDGWWAD